MVSADSSLDDSGGREVVERPTIRSLKIAILEALVSSRKAQHKMNLIGKGQVPGDLERRISRPFDAEDRALASAAFEELRTDGLIRATYEDLVSPELWVEITDAGRDALRKQCRDPLEGQSQS
jgi:hypothetical protein